MPGGSTAVSSAVRIYQNLRDNDVGGATWSTGRQRVATEDYGSCGDNSSMLIKTIHEDELPRTTKPITVTFARRGSFPRLMHFVNTLPAGSVFDTVTIAAKMMQSKEVVGRFLRILYCAGYVDPTLRGIGFTANKYDRGGELLKDMPDHLAEPLSRIWAPEFRRSDHFVKLSAAWTDFMQSKLETLTVGFAPGSSRRREAAPPEQQLLPLPNDAVAELKQQLLALTQRVEQLEKQKCKCKETELHSVLI